MPTSNQQNTTTTSSTKRQCKKSVEKSATSGPPLKSTRLEPKTSNPSRLNEKSEDKIAKKNAFQKQEERLLPISSLLASLPEPFDAETKAFASSLLSQAIQVIHSTRKLDYHEKNLAFLPSSIRFKYKLDCKTEHEDNQIYLAQNTKSYENPKWLAPVSL